MEHLFVSFKMKLIMYNYILSCIDIKRAIYSREDINQLLTTFQIEILNVANARYFMKRNRFSK